MPTVSTRRFAVLSQLVAAFVVASAACTADASAPAANAPPPHVTFTIASQALQETRTINVYLPTAAALDAQRRFPVVYMPDGGLAEDFPHAAATIDAAIAQRRMAPVILVGIENTQRRRDLTGPTSVDADREIAPVVGGSSAFRAFIASELIPRIDARYPVDGRRAIIGESLAGLFIVETFFESPTLFDTSIALDPSLWWNDGRLAADARTRLPSLAAGAARLRIVWAERERIGPPVAVLSAALAEAAPAGLDWRVLERPDLDHATIYRAMAPVLLPELYPATVD